MNQGTVKFFNGDKGFGFIKDDESNTEYFVHVTGLVDQIEEGDSVEFELTEGKKGLNAVNVSSSKFISVHSKGLQKWRPFLFPIVSLIKKPQRTLRLLVAPKGIKPLSQAPETCILFVELRSQT